MEKLIVPKDLGRFFEENESKIGNSNQTFNAINKLMMDHRLCKFQYNTIIFMDEYINDIIEVIKGEKEYEIKKEEFYALVKGWEKIPQTPHWAYNERKDEFTINYYMGHKGDGIKMTKDEWNELGINDSNADFIMEIY